MWIRRASGSRLPLAYLAVLGAWIVAACVGRLPAPSGAGDLLAVELAAARHMLETYPGDALSLDPSFARPVDAPGWPNAGRRDSARTAALARALRARVASGRTARGVHLLLSEPAVRGETAEITVTAAWGGLEAPGHTRSGYETRALVLARENGAWRVVQHHQLGIT